MIDLASLDHKTLAAYVGHTMTLRSGEHSVPLELASVVVRGDKVPHASRESFSVTFRGVPGLRIPQAIYLVENAELGSMEIFITQTGDGPQGSEFEAVFS